MSIEIAHYNLGLLARAELTRAGTQSVRVSHTRIRRDDAPESPAAGHRIGGPPPTGLSQRGLPVCNGCRHELSFVAEFDLHDERLGFRFAAARRRRHLTILHCEGCDTALREPLHYRPSRSGRSLRIARQEPGDPHDAPRTTTPWLEMVLQPSGEESFEGPFHQWGGDPLWLRDPVEPTCTRCCEPMVFLLQLDSEPRLGLRFGDWGILYGFGCSRCAEVAVLIQNA